MAGDHDFTGSQFVLFSAAPTPTIVLGCVGTDAGKLCVWCHTGLR